jgi:hypothetical protein
VLHALACWLPRALHAAGAGYLPHALRAAWARLHLRRLLRAACAGLLAAAGAGYLPHALRAAWAGLHLRRWLSADALACWLPRALASCRMHCVLRGLAACA